jgi:predicted nuclease of predicted toxin-antitoxin system
MKQPSFLADENVAAPLVLALREAGWDVDYVLESRPGLADDAVLQWASDEGRVLLTEDKDFGELVFRLKRNTSGVLMLRLPEGLWFQRWARLRVVLERHAERLPDTFTVVQPQNVRFRSID